jgi:methionyl-tRNA formyltransferase
MLNIHFSLLPRWRGAAPVERALLAGDAETGVCIMHVEEGLDTGAVVASWRTPISGADTTSSLTERLADAGARLLVEVLAGEIGPGVPQEGSGTHAAKITSDERIIDWSRSAVDIDRLVRALRPSTNMGDRSVKVIAARPDVGEGAGPPGTLTREGAVTCGSGVLVLETVQPSGRSPMPAADWIAGLRWSPGLVLGSLP